MMSSGEIMNAGEWIYAKKNTQHVFFNPEEKIVHVSNSVGRSKSQLPTIIQDKINVLPPGTFTNWTTRHFHQITNHWVAESVEILQNQSSRLIIHKKTFKII